MERRDYLLRLLEQMGRAIARVRELVTGNAMAEASQCLEQVGQEAGVPLPLVLVLSGESLHALLATAGQPDPLKQLLAAEYLYVAALRATSPQAAELFERARAQYGTIGPLADAALTAAVTERLAELERRRGAFDPPRTQKEQS